MQKAVFIFVVSTLLSACSVPDDAPEFTGDVSNLTTPQLRPTAQLSAQANTRSETAQNPLSALQARIARLRARAASLSKATF